MSIVSRLSEYWSRWRSRWLTLSGGKGFRRQKVTRRRRGAGAKAKVPYYFGASRLWRQRLADRIIAAEEVARRKRGRG